ncbi:cyclic nucleotide-gated ion channel 1-like [Prunus yedoensis var. nudiflora]|uniref:Cyclic nucleotide-gated ion channel 1-like n=1 Tax=Prunus yedoensis var. nudiflora TaxID=2094558 RepID=A0A314U5J8_PRUYE|nr:cyclic nucleotide-gated ion channel 1-like [Prunus yedoensis var. nudiflora]
MEPSLEQGVVTIPSSSRTIAEIIIYVFASVAEIVWTLVGITVDVLGFVVAWVRDLFSEYWPDDDSDEDSIEIGSPRKEERDATAKGKGICGRIFFSPLTRKSIFILSCIAVSLDPLFFYIPIIDEKDKCLRIDKNLKIAALIFRALPDATFALRTIISGYTIYTNKADDSVGILIRTYMCSIIGFVGILIAISLMLPIPQLAIAVFYFKLGGSGHFGQRVTVSVFLIIYYLASNFGTNLQTSSYEWENFFAVVISITGLLLFLYLLGNLQIYLQHAATKLVDADTKAEELGPKIDGKKTEIRTWMKTNKVPPDFVNIRRSELVKHIDDEVDVKFICSVMTD